MTDLAARLMAIAVLFTLAWFCWLKPAWEWLFPHDEDDDR